MPFRAVLEEAWGTPPVGCAVKAASEPSATFEQIDRGMSDDASRARNCSGGNRFVLLGDQVESLGQPGMAKDVIAP